MRKIYLFLLIILPFGLVSQAQHFIFDPTDNYENTVSHVFWTNHTVFMQNLTGGELILSWELLELDFPDEWQADLCDYVNCYMGIPENGTMLPVSDTTRGYLRITLNPNGLVGTGTVSFKVYDDKHPEMVDTVNFTIHTTILSDLAQIQAQQELSIYPNPAQDQISLHSNFEGPVILQILNLAGQPVLEHEVQYGGSNQIDVAHLPIGMYFVTAQNKNGILAKQKLLIH